LLFHFEEIAVEEEDSGILSKADSNEVEETPIEEEKNTIPSLKLVLDEIPIEFINRNGKLPASIYVRRCCLELYDMVTEIMLVTCNSIHWHPRTRDINVFDILSLSVQ
jgi:hypothetical protein